MLNSKGRPINYKRTFLIAVLIFLILLSLGAFSNEAITKVSQVRSERDAQNLGQDICETLSYSTNSQIQMKILNMADIPFKISLKMLSKIQSELAYSGWKNACTFAVVIPLVNKYRINKYKWAR